MGRCKGVGGREELGKNSSRKILCVCVIVYSSDNGGLKWVVIEMERHEFNLGYVSAMESTFLNFWLK